LILQFPEGKAPPPLYGVSAPKGQGKGPPISAKGGRGPGKYDGKTRSVNVTEEGGNDAWDENTGEQAEEEEAQDQGDDEGGSAEMDELADQLQETLTVTSEKLKALTQARRYGNPKGNKGQSKGKPPQQQTTAQKKATSTCRKGGTLGEGVSKEDRTR